MDRKELFREAAEEALLRESEDRRFLYKDVVELIQRGFLSQAVYVDDNLIVLRTLTSSETQDLLLRGTYSSEYDWMRLHIAASLYMINGFAVEPQFGGNHIHYVHQEWTRHLLRPQVDVLYAYVAGLRNRMDRAIRITDAYCHEGYSRSLWRMTGKSLTGENVIQRLWIAYNQAEDGYDLDLRQWAHTRAVVGSMTSKGAKSLAESEKRWEQRRKDRAQRTIEETVNWIISGDLEDQKPIIITMNGQTYEVPKVHGSQTVKEMEDEMMRAVRGEKDFHDVIVDQYKEYHRNRIAEARRKRQEALEKVWGTGEAGLQGETRFVGYTPEQLAEINPSLLKKKPNAQRSPVSPETQRFHQYLDSDVKIGWLGTQGPEEAASRPSPEDEGKSLQDKIARRTPRLKP